MSKLKDLQYGEAILLGKIPTRLWQQNPLSVFNNDALYDQNNAEELYWKSEDCVAQQRTKINFKSEKWEILVAYSYDEL